jgi:DNA primase
LTNAKYDSSDSFSTTKYVIQASIYVEGIVERPDVVGAIFGQTEGLLGEELDLRELQKTGRIGRIQVDIESKSGKSEGEIVIPSSLNRIETSILASALETVDRVGPCVARITLKQIEDIRETKRRKIVQRAANILKHWEAEVIPESQEISNRVLNEIKVGEIIKYGPDNLPAGPDIETSDEVIIVEGRADVLNLMRCGITNTVAVEGTNIPKSIIDIVKGKKVTVFFDDDRGGDLILKEIEQMINIDNIIKSTGGKGVEELTKKEIFRCLKNIEPFDEEEEEDEKEKHEQLKRHKEQKTKKEQKQQKKRSKKQKQKVKTPKIPQQLILEASKIKETLKSTVFNQSLEAIENIPVQNLTDKLLAMENHIKAVVFDGVVTQRLLDIAEEKKVEIILCARIGKISKKPINIEIIQFSQLNI